MSFHSPYWEKSVNHGRREGCVHWTIIQCSMQEGFPSRKCRLGLGFCHKPFIGDACPKRETRLIIEDEQSTLKIKYIYMCI